MGFHDVPGRLQLALQVGCAVPIDDHGIVRRSTCERWRDGPIQRLENLACRRFVLTKLLGAARRTGSKSVEQAVVQVANINHAASVIVLEP